MTTYSFPKTPSQWDAKSLYHRRMAVKHVEDSEHFDIIGNRNAGDFHIKAAEAHRRAGEALHYKEDPEGYKKAAEYADKMSAEANIFVKEDLYDPLSENSFTAKAAYSKIAGKRSFKMRGGKRIYPTTISRKSAENIYNSIEEGYNDPEYIRRAIPALKNAVEFHKQYQAHHDKKSVRGTPEYVRAHSAAANAHKDAADRFKIAHAQLSAGTKDVEYYVKPARDMGAYAEKLSAKADSLKENIINEISQNLLRSYVLRANRDKARADQDALTQERAICTTDGGDASPESRQSLLAAKKRSVKREAGISLAMSKYKQKNASVEESVTDLQEVSYKGEDGYKRYYYGTDLGKAFSHIVDNHKHNEVDTAYHPSAPNTAVFIAPAHGMIRHLKNVEISRGYPLRAYKFDHFIQLGSNVSKKTRYDVFSDVHDHLMDSGFVSVDYKGNPTSDLGKLNNDYIRLKDSEGNPHTLAVVRGTAWGGIGVFKGHQ